MHLDAEVAMIEGGVTEAATRIRQRETDVVTQKCDVVDVPARRMTDNSEQPFACRNDDLVTHGQPPDNA
jgi:hypothetical protein